MKIGDMVEWDFKGLPRQGTLVRLGQLLAHVQLPGRKEPIAVALSDCQLRLVEEGEPVEKYRPETAYAETSQERVKPCRTSTRENRSRTEKDTPMETKPEVNAEPVILYRACRDCRKPVDAPKARYCPSCRTERHRKANLDAWHKKNAARKEANAAKPLPKCVDCGAEVARKAKRCAMCIKAHKRKRQRLDYVKKIGKEPRPYHEKAAVEAKARADATMHEPKYRDTNYPHCPRCSAMYPCRCFSSGNTGVLLCSNCGIEFEYVKHDNGLFSTMIRKLPPVAVPTCLICGKQTNGENLCKSCMAPQKRNVYPIYDDNDSCEERIAKCIKHELSAGGGYTAIAKAIFRDMELGYIVNRQQSASKLLRDHLMELADVSGSVARAALTLLGELKRLENTEDK